MAAMLRMRESVGGTEGDVLCISEKKATTNKVTIRASGGLDIGYSKRTEQYVKAFTWYIFWVFI
jgi:hypothetical protein